MNSQIAGCRRAARREMRAPPQSWGGEDEMNREIPLYTLEGVQDADISTHYFNTVDGLGLSMLRFTRGGYGDGVLALHCPPLSTGTFVLPETRALLTRPLPPGYYVG